MRAGQGLAADERGGAAAQQGRLPDVAGGDRAYDGDPGGRRDAEREHLDGRGKADHGGQGSDERADRDEPERECESRHLGYSQDGSHGQLGDPRRHRVLLR